MITHQNLTSIGFFQRLLLFSVVVALSVFSLTTALLAGSLEDEEKHKRVIAMYNEYTNDFPEVTDISIEDALALVTKSDVVFVDVRKAKEQKVSMIPGAVTKKHFLKNLEKYRDKKIIAYCTISYRSGKFAEKMEKKGVSITNLQAGLLGWVHAHGPMISENDPTTTLHVYGKKWDLAPSGITTVF